MIYSQKPPKKYCCSSVPSLEARILSIYSGITSVACLFLFFLIYYHVKSQFLVLLSNSTETEIIHLENLNISINCPNDYLIDSIFNSSNEPHEINSQLTKYIKEVSYLYGESTRQHDENNTTTVSNNITQTEVQNNNNTKRHLSNTESEAQSLSIAIEDEDVAMEVEVDMSALLTMCQYSGNITNTTYSRINETKTLTMLDQMANFLLWNQKTKVEWILIPFAWNGLDILRAALLYYASSKERMTSSKIWLAVTTIMCLIELGCFVPILLSLPDTFHITFIHIFILILLYNFYALWIVCLLIHESMLNNKNIENENGTNELPDSSNNNSTASVTIQMHL